MSLVQRFIDWLREAWSTFTHGVDDPPDAQSPPPPASE